MDLDEQEIREFARIWKREFNEKLSADEARYHASQLLELLQLLAKPLPGERHQSPKTHPTS